MQAIYAFVILLIHVMQFSENVNKILLGLIYSALKLSNANKSIPNHKCIELQKIYIWKKTILKTKLRLKQIIKGLHI